MQTENKILIVDYLADPTKNNVLINIPDTLAETIIDIVPKTPKVTIRKSRHIRSEKQIESFNKVLSMMDERRKIKREIKEEAMVSAYFERKLKEMKIVEEEDVKEEEIKEVQSDVAPTV
jgi:hypothetical protein